MEKIKLKNSKKDFVWYILGSVCNAATSAILRSEERRVGKEC